MPYKTSEIIGALDALSDERYYFRIISPAISSHERRILREWSIRMALLTEAVRSRSEFEELEAKEIALEGYDPTQVVAGVFFTLLCDGWKKWEEGKAIYSAVQNHFRDEPGVAKLLMRHRALGQFTRIVRREAQLRIESSPLRADIAQQILRGIDMIGGPREVSCMELLDGFLNLPGLAARAKLIPTRYLALVQQWHARGITDPIAALIHECARHPNSVYGLNGRQFEHFIAEIFRAFDCDVELTAATRDQGRDIVCCRKSGSRPFKFAIETKRYARSRKVSVGLINQFLGANRKFDADRLLFVTTSSFTAPALRQAKENIDILRVRKFEDVVAWAGCYANASHSE